MGTKTYNDLSTFEGRFRFGIRDGPGVFTGADGSKLKGQFKDTRVESEEQSRVKLDSMYGFYYRWLSFYPPVYNLFF